MPPRVVRIGTAGWNIPRESAEHFPSGGTHLGRYAQVLNCAEINSSFYRPHRTSTWERWRDSVPAGFQFSVKAPRVITHDAELRCEAEPVNDFLSQAQLLGPKLGPVLFQLPPSLQFDRPSVMKFLKMLRQRFTGAAVFEPRHASWFCAPATELLLKFGVARVAADPACVPEAAQPGCVAHLVYFRLHGSPRRYYSSYDEFFLSELAGKIRKLSANADVWCVFDNTASGAAMQNALELRQKLQLQP
jgi:uncharacterized protein YecE (DUF72 family)